MNIFSNRPFFVIRCPHVKNVFHMRNTANQWGFERYLRKSRDRLQSHSMGTFSMYYVQRMSWRVECDICGQKFRCDLEKRKLRVEKRREFVQNKEDELIHEVALWCGIFPLFTILFIRPIAEWRPQISTICIADNDCTQIAIGSLPTSSWEDNGEVWCVIYL